MKFKYENRTDNEFFIAMQGKRKSCECHTRLFNYELEIKLVAVISNRYKAFFMGHWD